ncbi:hypothetical protein HDU98_005604 [Podochytrium sp. JEL0797]|nr:hypothetical protein HDU98_005604 [Podochytrium sp. JEL0797]
MQKADEERPDLIEFQSLKSHFEKTSTTGTTPGNLTTSSASSMADLFRASSIQLPSSLLASLPALAGALGGSKLSLADSGAVDGKDAVYEPKVVVDHEALERVDLERMNGLVIDQATTLTQRYQQLEDQPRTLSGLRPQRLLLRTKRAKRCKACDHALIKPEQKTQVTKFQIQLHAMDYIPTITLAHPLPKFPLEPGETYSILLKVMNPLTTPIRVMLAPLDAEQDASRSSVVTALAPLFTLDDIGAAGEKGSSEMEAGVVEKKGNWAVVPVEVVVLKMAGKVLEIPLLVQFAKVGQDEAQDAGEDVSFWIVITL